MTIEEVDYNFAKKSIDYFLIKKTINERGCFIPQKKPRRDGYVRYSVTKGSSMKAFGHEKLGEKDYYLHNLAWYVANRKVPNVFKCSYFAPLWGQ